MSTPTHRIEYTSVVDCTEQRKVAWTPAIWQGRATAERLAQHIKDVEAGTLPGGVNEHLGITRILGARIVRQATGRTVVTFAPAMFEVVA